MKGTVWPRPFTVAEEPKTGRKVRKPVKGSTWTYQFALPRADGKRRFVTKGGFKRKSDAELALAEALAEHGQTGGSERVEPSKKALAVYLREEWLPALASLKPTTREGYRVQVESYILDEDIGIGDVRLCDLTAGQLSSFYERLRTNGRKRKRGRRLSESSVHHVHVTLSAALGHAVETGLLRVSPTTQLAKKSRPKVASQERAEMQVWSADEARRFLVVAAQDRLGAMFDLALNTGLRRGELVGLRWSDVKLDEGIVSVQRNRTTVGYKVEDVDPKGKRARTVNIDPATVGMLRSHKAAQNAERLVWGPAWVDSGLVFTREDGSPLHPQTALWHLRQLARKAGVPPIRLHDLRHTHATLGLAAGVPPKVMQERLGHSSVQITLDLYSHVVPGMQADAAARIGAQLRGLR